MKEDLMEEKDLKSKDEMEEKLQEEKNNAVDVLHEEEEEKKLNEEETVESKVEEPEVLEQKENVKEHQQEKKEDVQNEKKEEKDLKPSKKVSKKEEKKGKEKKKQNKEDKQENEIEKKHTRKVKKIVISIIIIAIIALLFSTVFALTNINNQKIISGVTIEGIEVSGLTKEEAITKMETTYAEKMEKNIMLQYQDFESELNATLMEVKYDIEKAVNEAYSLGRDGNIFINNYHILGTLIGKRDFDVEMIMNEETTKQTINDIGANLPGIMIESSYSIEDDELIITRGKEGIVVSTDTLLNQVKDMLNDIHETENVIEIPVETKTPQEIDIDKIHSEVYQEPQDAYYTKDPFTIYPEVEGIDFDVEKAKEIIAAEEKEEYIIPSIITKPKVTIE